LLWRDIGKGIEAMFLAAPSVGVGQEAAMATLMEGEKEDASVL